MPHLALSFPAGRYHATPWGRHVNEGDVEWPPSPWRVLRALLAVGFTKSGWTEVPPDARALVDRLASVAPTYHLPAIATLAHSRHYMPQFRGATARVLDAFAYVGRSDAPALVVSWDVALTTEEHAVLRSLAGHLAYLGRAESWVAADCVDAVPPELEACAAAESPPAPGYDRVPLLAPLPPGDYRAWRDAFTGAAGPAKKKSKGADLPRDVADLLVTADTAWLERAGWNQPPGSRFVSYWRKASALTTTPPRHARPAAARPSGTTALFALASDAKNHEVLPPLTHAVPRAEIFRAALLSLHRTRSVCFSGKSGDGAPLRASHEHASILPISVREDGRIDHVIVHAPMRFSPDERRVLASLRHVYGNRLRRRGDDAGGDDARDRSADRAADSRLFVTLVGVGAPGDFASVVAALGESTTWISTTPFVPVRHLRPRGASSLEGQVQAELASRGLPAATHIEIECEAGRYAPMAELWSLWGRRHPGAVTLDAGAPGAAAEAPPRALAARWRHFVTSRRDPSKRPLISAAFGLRLTFANAVPGPLALGYASHYGLGQFRPAT